MTHPYNNSNDSGSDAFASYSDSNDNEKDIFDFLFPEISAPILSDTYDTFSLNSNYDDQQSLGTDIAITDIHTSIDIEDPTDFFLENNDAFSFTSTNDNTEILSTVTDTTTTPENDGEILYDFLRTNIFAPLPVQHMDYICEACHAMFFGSELTKGDRERYDKKRRRKRTLDQVGNDTVSFARCCSHGEFADFKKLFDTSTLDDNFLELILGKYYPSDTNENKTKLKTSTLFHKHSASFNNSLAFSFLHCTRKQHKPHGPQPFALNNMHLTSYLTRKQPREFTDAEKNKGFKKDELTGHQLYFVDNTMHWQVIKNKTNNTFKTESPRNHDTLNNIFNTLRNAVLNSALHRKLKQLNIIPPSIPHGPHLPNTNVQYIEQVFQIALENQKSLVTPNTQDHPVMLYQDTALSNFDVTQIVPHNNYLTSITQRNNFFLSLLFPVISPFPSNVLPMYTRELREIFPRLKPLQFYRMFLNIWKSDRRLPHAPENSKYNLINYCTKLFQMLLCILYCTYRSTQLNVFDKGSMHSTPNNVFGTSSSKTKSQVPSTVPLSPRNLKLFERQLNALVHNFGNPHLFITWTTSQDWDEFKHVLNKGESLYDRPEITVRVFFVKLEQILQRLNAMFGGLAAFGYRIEHQCRGLPHCHLLVWLKRGLNQRTIDEMIKCEIPDDTDDEYKSIVLKHYIHRHYKAINNPCLQHSNNGFAKCKQHFPYQFREKTSFENGQWHYRRPRNNEIMTTTTRNHSYPVSNQYVVPHIKYLAKLLKGHSCVMALPSLMTIKYMIKYVSKEEPGIKTAWINNPTLQNLHKSQNEVAKFKTYKSVDPMLAVAEIFAASKLTKVYPAIKHLPIHLDGKHYESGRMDAARAARTELVAYFASQQEEYNASTNKHLFEGIAYYDYPKYFVFEKVQRKWKKRNTVRHDIITHLHTPSHHGMQTELRYLRWLLLHVSDARSFQDLRTVGIHVFPTFALAAKHRGLDDNDALLQQTLIDARCHLNAYQLLNFYVTCLTHFPALDPVKHYREYLHEFVTNGIKNHPGNTQIDEKSVNQTIYLHLAKAAEEQGVTLDHLGLDSLSLTHTDNNITLNQLEKDKTHLDIYRQYQLESENRLTIKPLHEYSKRIKSIVAKIKQHLTRPLNDIHSHQHIHLFNSPAGSGKTTLINTIISAFKQEYTVLAVSPTGKASLLLIGGYTLHRLFALPIDVNSLYKHPKRDTRIGSLAYHSSLLVIDEAFSIHNTNITKIDNFLKDIRGTNTPFGGITTLLFGDIKQTLPIVPYGSHEQQKLASIASTELFANIPHGNKYILTKNYRILSSYNNHKLNHRVFFSQFHNSVLNGSTDTGVQSVFRECCLKEATKQAEEKYEKKKKENELSILTPIPTCFVTGHKYGTQSTKYITPAQIMQYQTMDKMITQVFPDLNSITNGNNFIMTTTRATCDKINQEVLNRLDTVEYELHAIDTPIEYLSVTGPKIDVLPTIDTKSTNLLPRCIKTKQNAICAITRNIDPSQGLTNGQRIRIIHCTNTIITAYLIQNNGECGNKVVIPRITIHSNRTNDFATFSRYQFPITNAFAITIDKSQGTTGSTVGIYLDKPVFTHGQLGVAITRAGYHKNLFFAIEDADINPDHGLVQFTCPQCRQKNNLMFTLNIVDTDLTSHGQN